MAVADHKGRSADGAANVAVVDEFPAGLDAAAQERVGCAAQHQALFLGKSHQLLALFKPGGQGLFTVNVLAGQQSGLGGIVMLEGPGQVQDDLNFGIGKQSLHGVVDLGEAVLFLRLLTFFPEQVVDAQNLHFLEDIGDVL